MQVKQKLFGLIVLVCGLFGLFFIVQIGIEKNRFLTLVDSEIQERKTIFSRQFEVKSLLQKKLSQDYSNWGEMVNFVQTGDNDWAVVNIVSGLSTFQADYAWVYRPDFSLVYSTSAAESSPVEITVPQEAVVSLFARQSTCHFFFASSAGIMEIFGATIVPSEDPERKTPAKGYFLVGTLLNQRYLEVLSQLNGAKVSLVKGVDAQQGGRGFLKNFTIHFIHPLYDWQGKQIAAFYVISPSGIIAKLSQLQIEFYAYYILFVVILVVILLYALNRWILNPLRFISQALVSQKKTFLTNIMTRGDEFGSIARLIANFFKQEQELVQEREALKQAYRDLRQAQNQLVQMEKVHVVGVLSSGVAHEVKNPLGIIQQGVDYLEREINPQDTRQHDVLDMIRKAVLRATKIIHDMLNFTRQSQLELTKQPFIPLVSVALDLVERQVILKNILVHKEFNDNQALVAVDTVQLQQVLVNIFLNAIQAMPERGELFVRTFVAPASSLKDGVGRRVQEFFEEQDTALVCEIEDTGTGVPADILPKIFDPFFTTKSPRVGVGLGLSVTRSIIDNHKGLIYIENVPQKGAKVVIALRVYTAEQPLPSQEASSL